MSAGRTKTLTAMTAETLAERTAAGEKLLAIDGIVFDVSVWAKKHPGGPELLYSCSNADATDIFYAFHPQKCTNSTAQKVLARLPRVGTIQVSPKSELQKDFELLRDNAVDIGLYKVCPWYYAGILSRVLLLLVLAISLTLTATTFSGALIAGLVMALYLQQAAFVGHDCGHNSVTFSSAFDGMLGFIVGPLLTGVSISWWKHSHNVHHVETNHQVAFPPISRAPLHLAQCCILSDDSPVSQEKDPDIQHLPIFALSAKVIAEGGLYSYYHQKFMCYDAMARFFVHRQHLFFFPIMCFARLNLYLQSYLFFFSGKYTGSLCTALTEFAGMTLHHALVLGLLCNFPTAKLAAAWFCATTGFSGVLNIQIVASHFGMPVLHEKDLLEFEQAPFFLRQLATTTDIETSWLSGWFFGGLEHQTVHHLFPRIPRRNLHRTAAMVKYFCMRHGIRYNSMTFSQAIAKVLANLRAQSRVARAQDGT